MFAIKVVNNSSNEVPSEIFALKEVGASGTSNEHVVYAFDYWFNVDSRRFTSRTFIKFQRCIETLEDYLVMLREARSSTDPLSVIEIMIQILSGVCHCHEHQVCHRDLKESNSVFLSLCC